MDYYEVVKKLIGPIDPVGETNEDQQRYKNLLDLLSLGNRALRDIEYVALDRLLESYSMKIAGVEAYKFLKSVKDMDID